MLGARFTTNIREEIFSWQKNLDIIAKTIEEWLECQRSWIYLETIFSTPDI
jgi:dynein heavy chain